MCHPYAGEAMTQMERFEQWYVPEPNSGCWLWLGGLSEGYGRFRGTINGKLCRPAHRFAFLATGGEIPEGFVLDHTCRTKSCVNPAHLRAVTKQLNAIENSNGPAAKNFRKTHCKRGHEFTAENTREYRRHRHCLTCEKAYFAAYDKTRRGKGSVRA